MEFFESQDRARRNSLVLFGLFSLAVIAIVVAVTAVVYGLYRSFFDGDPLPLGEWLLAPEGLMTMGAVVLVILGGSLHRFIDLAGGGERVARMVGAREVAANTDDAGEKQLRNLTEEMAIASGVTVPRLYVMDQEDAINAFVAGYQPNEAVLVVTRGALEQLSREELQGVIGHEYSHILNGDMRVNVRLIAMLSGILLIGQVGQYLLRSMMWRRHRHTSRRGNGLPVLAAGLALVVVGYVGLFFGRIIKAAVSRQREFLADAAAVQFTRNPEGIGGALYRIGLDAGGSHLTATSHAEDMNHMCFGESVSLSFGRVLASHPPIKARLDAIDETLMARMSARHRKATREAEQGSASQGQAGTAVPGAAMGFASGGGPGAPRPSATMGTVTSVNTNYARQLLASLPGGLNQQLHEPEGAVHLCFALALDGIDHETITKRVAELEPVGAVAIDELLVRKLGQNLSDLGPAYRVPLMELALPALRELEPQSRKQLFRDMEALIREERGVRIHDIAIFGFLKRHLHEKAGRNRRVTHRRYAPLMGDVRNLLWVMASTGTSGDTEALYREAMAGFESTPKLPENRRPGVRDLLASLKRLGGLAPMLKPALIDACAHCVLHDNEVSAREYELLRIIADQLDGPMPPLPVTGSPAA